MSWFGCVAVYTALRSAIHTGSISSNAYPGKLFERMPKNLAHTYAHVIQSLNMSQTHFDLAASFHSYYSNTDNDRLLGCCSRLVGEMHDATIRSTYF